MAIAQALVSVRPDLTGFAGQVRTQLKKQLDQVGVKARSLTVTATLAPGSAAALQKQLNKITSLTVRVTPILLQKDKVALQRAIGTVPVKVALVQARGAAQQIVQQSTAAAPVAAAQSAAAGLPRRTVPDQSLAVFKARQALEAETRDLSAAEADLAAAQAISSKAATRAAQLAAQGVSAQAKLAASIASEGELVVQAAQKRVTAIASETAAQEAQASAAQVAEAAMTALAASNTATTATSDRQALAAIAVAEALDKQAIAAGRVAEAQLGGASAQTLSARQRDLEKASLAVRGKEAEAAKIAAAEVAAEEAPANAAREAAAKAQLDIEKQIANARLLAARSEGTIAGGGTRRTELNLAKKAAEEAGQAAVAATELGNVALAEEATKLQTNLALRAQGLEQDAAALALTRARLPIVDALAAVERKALVAADVNETLAARKKAALAVDVEAAKARKVLAGATAVARKEDFASLVTIQERTAAQLRGVEIDLAAAAARDKAAAAAAREATVLNQASRGAIGTGAGFLGLRGAILSASGGFLAATIAVTALAKTIGTASQLQQSFNVFQAVAGATADQMARVSAEAKSLGADLSLPATSANDASAAMTELARAGLSVDDSIGAARGVLQLAAAANIQVAESATIVATELNAFGLEGAEATRVADLLTGAAKSAQGEIGDFALAFQQVAAVANQVQLPIETTTAILTQFAKAGLRGSDAGTSLRTMLLRLVPTTKAAATAQAELGIQLDRSLPIGDQFLSLVDQYTSALSKLGPIAQQEALTKIFGQDAIRGATISLTNGREALVGIEAEVSQAGLAAEQSAARMKGLSGAIEGLKSAIETFAGTLGSTTLPALESITTELSTIITTADAAVQALQKLGDVGIGPVTPNAVTGALSDPLAGVGIAAGAALGVKKLIEIAKERAARKAAAAAAVAGEAAVAEAGVAAAAVTEAAWVKSAGGVIISSRTQTAVQVASARTVTAENVRAAAASVLAWAKASSLIKGLAVGVAASIGGDLLSGNSEPGSARSNLGGTLSGAGQGAVIGSIIPGVGTAVGAAAGALFGAVTTATAGRKAQEAKWDALSAEEQWSWFLEQEGQQADGSFATPGRGSGVLALFGFTLKANPFNARSGQSVGLQDFTSGFQDLAVGARTTSTGGAGASTTTFSDKFGPLSDFLARARASATKAVKQIKENKTVSAELELAIAQAAGDTEGADAATKKLIAITKSQIKATETLFNTEKGGIPLVKTAEETLAFQKKLTELYKKLTTQQSSLNDASSSFALSIGVQIANIQAGATAGFGDNLVAQQAALSEINKALAKAIADGAKKADIDALKIQQAQQNATISGTNDQIASKAEADAKQRIANAQELLRIAADAAGNIGAAENKLIAFLKAQTTRAGQTTAEMIAARSAYNAEIKKRQDALQGIVDATVGLRDAKLNTKLAQADLTATNADNIKIFRQQIKNDEDDIKRIKAQAAMGAKTQAERIAYLTQIQGELQDITRLKGQIKNAKEGSGGFSLADLFNEVVKEAKQFGSNIASRGGILSPQDARGAFSNQVIANNSGNPLLTVGRSQLSEQQKTNQILAGIASRRNYTPPPNTIASRRNYDPSAHPENANRGSTRAIEHAAYLKDITG